MKTRVYCPQILIHQYNHRFKRILDRSFSNFYSEKYLNQSKSDEAILRCDIWRFPSEIQNRLVVKDTWQMIFGIYHQNKKFGNRYTSRVHTETEPNFLRTFKDISNMNFKCFSSSQKISGQVFSNCCSIVLNYTNTF
jgi:hypothetical protein